MDQALLDGVIAVIPAKISMSILTLRYVSILAIAYVATASYLISNESRGSCRMKSTLPLWLK